MELGGLHHLTAVTGDAPANVAFYTGVLGLRLVKKTVNQDDVSAYHLFYGDEVGNPGTEVTFFDWPWRDPSRARRRDDRRDRAARARPRRARVVGRALRPTSASPTWRDRVARRTRRRCRSPTPRASGLRLVADGESAGSVALVAAARSRPRRRSAGCTPSRSPSPAGADRAGADRGARVPRRRRYAVRPTTVARGGRLRDRPGRSGRGGPRRRAARPPPARLGRRRRPPRRLPDAERRGAPALAAAHRRRPVSA